jgi:Toxin SymE, type I toxin-antitoxin system
VLEPDVITNIRAIFIHNGEPVAVDEAARLLGWGIDTIDEAIKWNVIELDTTSHDQPRIRRAELLEQAFEQWSLADIESALTRTEWKALVTRCGVQYDRLVVRDRDTLRSALRNDAERAAASAALLLPDKKAAAARRNARPSRRVSLANGRRFARRGRTDGVRVVTLTAFEVSYRDLVPMLRIRGRWLARLGFKPGMRVYITTAPGELVMTVSDPAAAKRSTAPRPQLAVVPPLSASQQPSRVAHRA